MDSVDANVQSFRNIVNEMPTLSNWEIDPLRAAVESVQTTLTDVNLSVDSVNNKGSSRVRQPDSLFRGLQSKVDQYAK